MCAVRVSKQTHILLYTFKIKSDKCGRLSLYVDVVVVVQENFIQYRI